LACFLSIHIDKAYVGIWKRASSNGKYALLAYSAGHVILPSQLSIQKIKALDANSL
jgi:hypothetical protein